MAQEPDDTTTTAVQPSEELIVSSMTLSTGGFQIPGFEPTHAVTLDVSVIGEGIPEGETRTMKLFLELEAAAELAEVFPGHVAAAREQARQQAQSAAPVSPED